MNTFIINQDTRLSYDECYRSGVESANSRLSQYALDSRQINDSSLNHTEIRGLYRNNYDGKGKYVNDETTLRTGQRCSEKGRVAKTLDTVLFAGPPFMGNGSSVLRNPDVKSRLMNSEQTHVKKSTAPTCGVTIDRFTPLLPCIADNVQNTEHIIPEHWVRGGMSTRSVIRNADYIKGLGQK
jgi:hypothetical protein